METLRRPKDIVHVALQHGKDHEELARKQFTAEHKKEVSSLIKYFFFKYLQDLAYVHFDTVLVTFKSLVQHR